MMDKRWKVLRSKRVIDTPWFSLRAEAVQMPSGVVMDPFYISEKSDWVNVVALTPAQELVLVRQYRHGLGRMVLEVPGGCIDPEDPSPKAAARRELLEETGFTGTNFIQTGTYSPNPNDHDNMVYSFLVQDVTLVAEQELDHTEDLEVVLYPLSKLEELLHGGEFLQAMHIAALFLGLEEFK